jgi:protein-L-isoaspartate(D-aspartate) O-methyltransferase
VTDDPAAARAAMVDALRGHIRRPAVAEALGAVPRHLFLPGVAVAQAYDPGRAAVTTQSAPGVPLSSASSPGIVGLILDQLDLRPGQRVLEIGAGTGWNAALLAHLVGSDGAVVTVDVDPDCTTRAHVALTEAGYGGVTVITGDGLRGAPGHGVFDRIVVTAGAWDVPPAWTAQLAPGGRLVVPLRWRGQTRSTAFVHGPDGVLRSDDLALCGFIPLAGPDGESRAPIDAEATVTMLWDRDQPVDPTLLVDALDDPGVTVWSGIRIGPERPADGVWLRLVVDEPGAVGLLAHPDRLHPAGGVSPFLLTRTQGVVDGASLGVLVLRRHGEGAELGARGVGPGGAAVADRVRAAIGRWAADPALLPVVSLHPAGTPDDRLPAGTVVEKVHRRLVAAYP